MIEILFVTRKKFNLFSWIIKKIERCKFSHMAFRITFSRISLIAHADAEGVHIDNEDSFNHYNKIFDKKIINADETLLFKYIVKHTGKKYGFLTIIGMGISRLFKIKNPFKDRGHTFICSELVITFLQEEMGLHLGLDPEKDNLKRIYDVLMEVKNAR